MSAKTTDRLQLIENPCRIKSKDHLPTLVVPPNTPVTTTTVVISTPSGVHVAPRNTPAVNRRTGRYLALCGTLTMIFIMLYHTFLRQVPVLAGLIPPAIIMALYLIWVLYFAHKKKRQVQVV